MADFYYDLSSLTEEQITNIIVKDTIDGYSTKQIMDAYRLTFVQVAGYLNAFKAKCEDIDFQKLRVDTEVS